MKFELNRKFCNRYSRFLANNILHAELTALMDV